MSRDDTPTIPSETVQTLLKRVRKSSQERVSIAKLMTLKIMMVDGLLFRESCREQIEGVIRNICVEYLDIFSEQHRKILRESNEETEEKLDLAARQNRELRKAILDYVNDGDLEKLTRKAFE